MRKGVKKNKSKYKMGNTVKNFNWLSYLDNNKDLRVAGINTQEKAIRHYLRFGKKENRIVEQNEKIV